MEPIDWEMCLLVVGWLLFMVEAVGMVRHEIEWNTGVKR